MTVRGLNDNHNRELKNLFKSAAVSASTRPGPLRDFYVARVENGMRPTMARLTLARKDCRDQFGHLEERSRVRRPTIPSTSSLSISEEQAFHLGGVLRRWAVGFCRCSVRGEYQSMRSAPCAAPRVTHYTLCPFG